MDEHYGSALVEDCEQRVLSLLAQIHAGVIGQNHHPVGLQIIGQPFNEAGLLAIARAYEQGHDWHTKHPNL